MLKDDCQKFSDSRSQISLSDKNSSAKPKPTYRADNSAKSNVTVYEIDDCVITSSCLLYTSDAADD